MQPRACQGPEKEWEEMETLVFVISIGIYVLAALGLGLVALAAWTVFSRKA